MKTSITLKQALLMLCAKQHEMAIADQRQYEATGLTTHYMFPYGEEQYIADRAARVHAGVRDMYEVIA